MKRKLDKLFSNLGFLTFLVTLGIFVVSLSISFLLSSCGPPEDLQAKDAIIKNYEYVQHWGKLVTVEYEGHLFILTRYHTLHHPDCKCGKQLTPNN